MNGSLNGLRKYKKLREDLLMNDFDILKELNPHLVTECENPEALLNF